jgi:pimeloyl-ACP methyl ester carboxylesterase
MERFRRDGLTFPVRDAGPPDGEPVVLLHGFPGGAATWDRVVPRLTESGCRVLVPDQRGYPPNARPSGRSAYGIGELVRDVLALADAAGIDRFHLAGHDWGGMVGWAVGARHPERLRTLTLLSTPHPKAMHRSLLSSFQLVRSWYIGLFWLPGAAERVLLARDATMLRTMLVRSGLDAGTAERYVRRMQEPGALTGALAWYRAVRPGWAAGIGPVQVPTSYLWSSADAAIDQRAAALSAEYVTAPYRFRTVDAPHWLPECEPELVATTILERIDAPTR